MLQTAKNGRNVVSALHARSNFGKLLRRVAEEQESLVIEKRGMPQAVLMSLRDYVRLAAPEPEVLRLIGEQSRRRGTNKLGSGQIDRVIVAARAATRAAARTAARRAVKR
jgi:prevent-host-death family protein